MGVSVAVIRLWYTAIPDGRGELLSGQTDYAERPEMIWSGNGEVAQARPPLESDSYTRCRRSAWSEGCSEWCQAA